MQECAELYRARTGILDLCGSCNNARADSLHNSYYDSTGLAQANGSSLNEKMKEQYVLFFQKIVTRKLN